jgi:hemerythrin-like metal-binding protein
MPNLPSNLVIGVPFIDAEHRSLFLLLDQLIYDPNATADMDRFKNLFDLLGEQLAEHFESEEGLLHTCGMPQAEVAAHVQAHMTILEQYIQLNLDLMDDKPDALSGFAKTVKNWVVGHVVEHDLKIRKYVSA